VAVVTDTNQAAHACPQGMLEDAERTSQTWQDKHREVLAELRVASDKCRQQASLSEDYKLDLEGVMKQLEDEQRNNGALHEQMRKLKGELATSTADVEQLKSLALAGTRSQSDLEAKLASQAAELRSAHAMIQQLNDDVQQGAELQEQSLHQQADAQAVIQRLDAERDKLQVMLQTPVSSQPDSIHVCLPYTLPRHGSSWHAGRA
jgi:chromosome segregation ATPase